MIKRLLLVFLVALTACGTGGDTASEDSGPQATAGGESSVAVPDFGPGTGDQVVIDTFIFRPNPLQVEAGTTVTWNNQDRILHTVTSGERGTDSEGDEVITKDGMFDADLDGVGATFSFTFEDPGTYQYLCTIHPGMDAEVVVS